MGETKQLKEDKNVKLTAKEEAFFQKWHNKILIVQDKIINSNYLSGSGKKTLGVGTSFYDWKQNSAGQDNIGKIILSILSFKRLKEKFLKQYQGGILAIDELDATLYPGSQLKLFEALRDFASKFQIQIIFTTHSLTILEKACELNEKKELNNQVKIVYLEKMDGSIKNVQNPSFNFIKHKLQVTIEKYTANQLKIDVYTEDQEAVIFLKALLKSKKLKLRFNDCTFSGSILLELAMKNIASFSFPNSLIVLDGDVKNDKQMMKKIKKLNNIILLPTKKSPERILAQFLSNLSDHSQVWAELGETFDSSYCFRDYTLSEILDDRTKAKDWFNSHKPQWGQNATKVINPWIKANKVEYDQFISEFIELYNKYAAKLALKMM